ncbi:cysteine desulfurase-like protein [Ectobacillus ponti]|uniref:Cysteine desulfurase-like protein n=1 Tax=Ectobacillus ponti TaxID=2961894 RepID=A0AA41XDC4_9BACI|nr:cysteine desulfurase-like protein [Ectobacillus ponti]MCP8970793.1 cysteine desulfurase-like protein [Ectobacillus ponti]
MYPIEAVRRQFPALTRTYNGKPAAYMDGPGGSQVVQGVIDAMVSYMSRGGANLHGEFPTSRETEQHIADARQAIADLVGAKPQEVAFGQNSTSLMFAIARSLSKSWNQGDNIVTTEIDHRSNVDSWATAAADRGTDVRMISVDTDIMMLDTTNLQELIDSRTRLVCVTLASNAVGTITNLSPIVRRAREVGALVAVDAVHAVPHFCVDRDALDADIVLCSAYKFFGPHVGIAVIRETLFQSLPVYKLQPAPVYIPDKLETGTQNHEAISALPAAVDFIASLGEGDSRRERLYSAFRRIEAYENQLAQKLRQALAELPQVQVYQAPEDTAKTPTVAFRIKQAPPEEVCRWMAENHSIFIASGDFYASTLAEKLGIGQNGGWIRAGLAPYSTEAEIDRLIAAVKAYIHSFQPEAASSSL